MRDGLSFGKARGSNKQIAIVGWPSDEMLGRRGRSDPNLGLYQCAKSRSNLQAKRTAEASDG